MTKFLLMRIDRLYIKLVIGKCNITLQTALLFCNHFLCDYSIIVFSTSHSNIVKYALILLLIYCHKAVIKN